MPVVSLLAIFGIGIFELIILAGFGVAVIVAVVIAVAASAGRRRQRDE